jgi:hypothetical protein
MKITYSMLVMFVASFILHYFIMPPIMLNKVNYCTNYIVKAYLATIMALFMVTIAVIMHDHQYHVFSINWYAILFALLSLFIYLYRKQIAVNDKQYIEGMIEHHSMALLTSEEILKKTDNYDVAKVAKKIIQSQNDEIQFMTDLLKK